MDDFSKFEGKKIGNLKCRTQLLQKRKVNFFEKYNEFYIVKSPVVFSSNHLLISISYKYDVLDYLEITYGTTGMLVPQLQFYDDSSR